MNKILFVIFFGFLILISGCMTRKNPVFYPNEKFSSTSPETRDEDVRECQALADEYVAQPDKFTQTAKSGLVGGAIGAGAGAVGGAFYGKAGRGAGVGAAVGGVVGVLSSLFRGNEESPTHQRFVAHCLEKKGYEIVR